MAAVRTVGDLRRLFLALDRVFFDRGCQAAGIRVRWKPFRSVKGAVHFAEFDIERKVIRVNAFMSDADVPEYVVSAVLFHEMLHHFFGYDHDAKFQKAEHRHPYFYEAEEWTSNYVLEHS